MDVLYMLLLCLNLIIRTKSVVIAGKKVCKNERTSRGPSMAEISDERARKRCSNEFARSANLRRNVSLMLCDHH